MKDRVFAMRAIDPSTDHSPEGKAQSETFSEADPARRTDSLELVLGHARVRAWAPALKDDDESLSFGELHELVGAIASGMAELGVLPGDRVALWLPNSAEFIASTLACLWVGAVFVPLSLDDPPARITRIIEDSKPKLVLSRDRRGRPALGPSRHRARRLVDLQTILRFSGLPPTRAHDPERDAYLVYTSGTTGEPKGIRVPEKAFSWAISCIGQLMNLDTTTRALCVSPFHFDGSYGTAFPTLAAGGSLVIPRRDELLFLRRFFRAVLEEGITHTGFSPSYLRLLLSSSRVSSLGASQLKTLGLGGEECIGADVARLWEVLPELRVFNRYGPTETTIEVTTYEVSRADVASGKIPLGVPHPGVGFHILGDDGSFIEKANQTGELYISGNQLMSGYWGDQELNDQVLRRDLIPGETLYKTGDLVDRGDDGFYRFVGRTDDVVKRGGVRTSLGEIARVLRRVHGVSRALCLSTDRDGRLGIAAFVEASSQVTVPSLLEAAAEHLPTSMLPDEVFVVPSLPMNSSGKVDPGRLLTEAGRRAWHNGMTEPGSPGCPEHDSAS